LGVQIDFASQNYNFRSQMMWNRMIFHDIEKIILYLDIFPLLASKASERLFMSLGMSHHRERRLEMNKQFLIFHLSLSFSSSSSASEIAFIFIHASGVLNCGFYERTVTEFSRDSVSLSCLLLEKQHPPFDI
jgi:hypothetical protein